MIKPPKLMPGATIAVVAPGGSIDPVQLTRGISALESLGYKVIVGEHVYKAKGYLAGQDSERLNDLNQAIQDREVQAIFCARGGYGSMRLLQGVDYKAFASRAKIFVGFSDITALLHAFYHRSKVITFHGPVLKNFQDPDDPNLKALVQIITGEAQWRMELDQARVLRPGKVEGKVLGGNLSMITSLVGTPYFPSLEGCILFIEDTNEPLYRIDRMLMSLRFKGSLAKVNGIMAGEFHSCGNNNEVDSLLLELTRDLNIPIISGAPFGHGKRNLPFPIGMPAVLDTERMIVRSECPVR